MAYHLNNPGNFDSNFEEMYQGCYASKVNGDLGNFNGTHINITSSEAGLECSQGCPVRDYGGHLSLKNDDNKTVLIEACPAVIQGDILLTSGAEKRHYRKSILLALIVMLSLIIPNVSAQGPLDAFGLQLEL